MAGFKHAVKGMVLLCIRQAVAQVFLAEPGFDAVSIEFPDNLSPACQKASNESVACNSTLADIAMNGLFPNDDDLLSLCTQDCLASLDRFRSNQLSACNATDTMTAGGITYPPTFGVDQLLFTYNYTCRKDVETGEFCAPQIAEWANGTLTAQQNCSDCLLGTYESQLNSYFGYEEELAAEFSFLTSSCQKTGYLVTSPTPYLPNVTQTTNTSAPTPTTTPCSEKYVIRDGDDCHSISNSQNVSTSSLLYKNKLGAHCVGFPGPGTELCLPEQCTIYTVKDNDSCWGIVQAHNYAFTVTQLVSWNADINRGCSNLEQLTGLQICISMPGDNTPSPPSPNTSQVTTAAPIPSPVRNGTNTNCAKYYRVASGDTCSSLSVANSISLDDFYFLNREINSTCGNLELGAFYCVQAVGDIKTYSGYGGATSRNPCLYGTSHAASCYATSVRTDTYWAWPTAESTTMAANVTAPSALPVAPGTSEECADYQTYLVRRSNRTNTYTNPNSCVYIAYYRGIDVEQFVEWNPSLSYNESNAGACVIKQGYRYCAVPGTAATAGTSTRASSTAAASSSSVATATSATDPSTAPATTPATKTTTTTEPPSSTAKPTSVSGTATPTPTQEGMTAGCTSWRLVQQGDTCYDIAQDAGISLNDFYKWNPAVGSDCNSLKSGYYCCIGV